MLTSDDGSTDGEKRRYLTEPEKWRHHDPELFDLLAAVDQPHQRSVTLIQYSRLFPGSVFHSGLLSERAVNRDQYFEGALVRLKSNPVIFFDPDNGMEVDSVGRNSRGRTDIYIGKKLRSFMTQDTRS
jgi:hypothetical protein